MKRTLLYVMMCCAFAFVKAQTTYVVSVGIADYAYINDLKSTERDVACFNEVMKTHTKHVNSLTGQNATHARVLDAMNVIFGKAKKEDAVIFFFSGHGFPGGFCCYDTKDESSGLSYKEMQQVFKNCKATRKMIFADACFSGGMRSSKKQTATTSTLRKENVMIFLSSRTNEASIERGQNGLYTRCLVQGLRGGADANRDRKVTAKELYNFVHEGVVQASNQKQHPVMWGKFDDAMVVLNWNKR